MENVSWAPDIVFNLDISDYRIEKGDYYIVSVVDLAKDGNDEEKETQAKYEEFLIKIIEMLKENGSKVVLMSFCDGQGDNKVIERIISRLPNLMNIVTFLYGKEGIETSIDLFSKCKGVIATRYHAMILGMLFQKEILPIVYSKKMSDVLNDLEYKGKIIDIKNLPDIIQLEICECFGKIEEKKLKETIINAQKQFLELDKIFIAKSY